MHTIDGKSDAKKVGDYFQLADGTLSYALNVNLSGVTPAIRNLYTAPSSSLSSATGLHAPVNSKPYAMAYKRNTSSQYYGSDSGFGNQAGIDLWTYVNLTDEDGKDCIISTDLYIYEENSTGTIDGYIFYDKTLNGKYDSTQPLPILLVERMVLLMLHTTPAATVTKSTCSTRALRASVLGTTSVIRPTKRQEATF